MLIGSIIRGLGLALAIGVICALGALTHGFNVLLTPVKLAAAADYLVAPGARFADVAGEWQARGLVSDTRWLSWYARVTGAASRIRAGEYAVVPGTTPLALLRQSVVGRIRQHTITFVEGWTFRQFREALAGEPRLRKTLDGQTDAQVMALLGAAPLHPEGRFFPDTYYFSREQSDLDILRRAYAAMNERLAAAWARRAADLPYRNRDDALIMASIVEKETGAPDERGDIAGVFVRRLRKNMRLQTDPTVIYGMGDRYDGNIRRRDLREDTPYNTYVHKGLPPTPIANPGAAALEAAVRPGGGTALYFVSKGDGTHQFSDTYEEHRRAVRVYQLSRRSGGS